MSEPEPIGSLISLVTLSEREWEKRDQAIRTAAAAAAGFVVWSRSVRQSWLWQLKAEHFKVAFTCVLKANWAEREWFAGSRRITIPRGSFVTSMTHLAEGCGSGITARMVRRAIDNLMAGKFLKTVHPAGKAWTLITILNYDRYQAVSEDAVKRTVKGRSKGGQSAVNKRTK